MISKESLETLEQSYQNVMQRVAEAAVRSGRSPDQVIAVAVTKYATPEAVRAVVEMGHEHLGESRVQQLVQRVPMLDEFLARRNFAAAREGVSDPENQPKQRRIRWHMVGHLQRNKVKQIAPVADLIHSVDSLRLAEELHGYRAANDPDEKRQSRSKAHNSLEEPIQILLQVNVSGEASKYGIAAPAAIHLVEQIETMVHLNLRGIMTMAPHSDNPEDARSVFARCRELFEDIKSSKVAGPNFNILSMGMTGDFEVAIEEGANLVRIGRGFFGDQEAD